VEISHVYFGNGSEAMRAQSELEDTSEGLGNLTRFWAF